jgi:hypothetical protein
MKTVFVPIEGVDATIHGIFGDPSQVVSESQFLIRLKLRVMSQLVYTLNYRETDDGYLQLIMIFEDEPLKIATQFHFEGVSLKEMVACSLIRFLGAHCWNLGYPRYLDSVAFSESEYDFYVRTLKADEETHAIFARLKKLAEPRFPLDDFKLN